MLVIRVLGNEWGNISNKNFCQFISETLIAREKKGKTQMQQTTKNK